MSQSYHNYINLKYYNYLQYEDDPASVFETTRKRLQKQFLTKKINQAEKQEIENRLNYFYDATNGNFSNTALLDRDSFNAMVEGVYEYIENTEGKGQIAIGSGLEGGKSKYSLNTVIDKIDAIENTTRIKLSTVDAKIQGLERLRAKISATPVHDTSLLSQLDMLIAQWGTIKTSMRPNSKQYISIQEHKGFFQEYNQLVNDLFKYDKNITGLVGEAMSAGMLFLTEQSTKKTVSLAKDDIAKALAKSVIGAAKSIKGFNATTLLSPMLSKKDLAQVFNDKTINNINYQGQYINAVMNANDIDPRGTQDKVDIIFNFNQSLLRASVKNYQLNNPFGQKHGIHLVSGTNPFVLLNNEAKFLQHYFNVTSDHGYQDTNREWHGSASTQLEAPPSLIAEAHKTAKLVMFANALAGGQLAHNTAANVFNNTAQANLFIINNISEKKYRVFFVSELIDKVIDNFSLLNVVKGYPEDLLYKYDITGWENMSRSGKERMMKIYSQMNKFKIDISLDYSAILGGGLQDLI